MTYEEAIKSWRPDQWRTFGEQGGTIGTDDSLVGGGLPITNATDPMSTYMNKEGLFGVTNNTWGNLGQAAGLAGIGYGLYDSIWGNKAKLFKERLGMLKEQRAANQEMLENKRKFNETWSNSSNSLAASGLNKGL